MGGHRRRGDRPCRRCARNRLGRLVRAFHGQAAITGGSGYRFRRGAPLKRRRRQSEAGQRGGHAELRATVIRLPNPGLRQQRRRCANRQPATRTDREPRTDSSKCDDYPLYAIRGRRSSHQVEQCIFKSLDGNPHRDRLSVRAAHSPQAVQPSACVEIHDEPRSAHRSRGSATERGCKVRLACTHEKTVTLELRETAADTEACGGSCEVESVSHRTAP